jgi:hypothetical protein
VMTTRWPFWSTRHGENSPPHSPREKDTGSPCDHGTCEQQPRPIRARVAGARRASHAA